MDKFKTIAMVPARMGSKRLKKKQICLLAGVPLINHAIRRCKDVNLFDEIWVNAEHDDFGKIAEQEGVRFHRRPIELSKDNVTSESYIYEFLKKHDCDYIFQVHSIAPFVTPEEITDFVNYMVTNDFDVLLSGVNEQIECCFNGKPINFIYDEKTNSQELVPIMRVTWAITGWKRKTYLDAYEAGKCATYSGKIGYRPLNRISGHIIKTTEDLNIAEALFKSREIKN